MPPAKRSTSSRRTTSTRRSTSARKSSASSEPAALKRLNKSLEGAQNALTALRKDVSKDVSTGTQGLYKDLQKFVSDAQRNGGRLSKALQKDLDRLQKQVRDAAAGRKTSAARRTSSSGRSTAKRSTSRSRSGSGSRTRSGSRKR
jgi:hypothetical protein